jgi:hypothetical protein
MRWVATCSAMLVAACASVSTDAPENLVKQRAGERWQALIAGDFDKAYSYNTAGFRQLVTPADYRGRTGTAVKWLGAQVSKINCPEAEKCDVQIKLDYKPLLANVAANASFSTYLDESWLLENGQWSIYQPVAK